MLLLSALPDVLFCYERDGLVAALPKAPMEGAVRGRGDDGERSLCQMAVGSSG